MWSLGGGKPNAILLQLLGRDLEELGKKNSILALAAEVLQLRSSCPATVQVCDRASSAPREPTSARRARPRGVGAAAARSAARLLAPPKGRSRLASPGPGVGGCQALAPTLCLHGALSRYLWVNGFGVSAQEPPPSASRPPPGPRIQPKLVISEKPKNTDGWRLPLWDLGSPLAHKYTFFCPKVLIEQKPSEKGSGGLRNNHPSGKHPGIWGGGLA